MYIMKVLTLVARDLTHSVHFERRRETEWVWMKGGRDVAWKRDGGDPGAGEIFREAGTTDEITFLQGGGYKTGPIDSSVAGGRAGNEGRGYVGVGRGEER